MSVAEQVEQVRVELRDAQAGAERLAGRASDAQWTASPKSGGWSAAECIAHLTMTTDAYIPRLGAALATVPAGTPLPSRYRMGFGGWMLARILEPPARMKSRTIPEFVPGATAPKAETLAAFLKSQDALLQWMAKATGVALDKAMISSPFNARLKYNAYAALRVMAAHQRRHLWQAERAVRGEP